MAFEFIKAILAHNLDNDEDHGPLARNVLAEIIEDQMAAGNGPIGANCEPRSSSCCALTRGLIGLVAYQYNFS
jgi:hypothetical protein